MKVELSAADLFFIISLHMQLPEFHYQLKVLRMNEPNLSILGLDPGRGELMISVYHHAVKVWKQFCRENHQIGATFYRSNPLAVPGP